MMKFIPKKHQNEASRESVDTLTRDDRANVIMPCGTGKTMVGNMVAEALNAKKTILLFPSIALIRQTLSFWRNSGYLEGKECMCVCSDQTVAEDNVDINDDEMGMHITTSSEEAASFFVNASKDIVVFSTYQSAPVVATAMPSSFSFDFGLFDESHRAATGDETLFSFALLDENIRISKRLFMTATPKYLLNEDGTSKTYSMDNEAIFGKRAYVLPLREAINDGLISDYKVLVSVVTTNDLAEDLNIKKLSNKPNTDTKMLATAIAIRKAIDATGVKKVITFHNTVMAARKFAESTVVKNTVKTDLMHVSGEMKSKLRSQIMDSFAAAEESLVTNARCLTEGVDSPGVDMVVFVDAKESTTDIVQAVGRAMRVTKDKNVGYILLPVFIDLEKHEGDIEAALKVSGMSTIWDVLSNMSEQESMIAYKRSSNKTLREARKQRIQYEIVSSDPKLSQKLHESIDVYYAYRNASVFDDNFDKLVKFVDQHGHCNPSPVESEELNTWLKRVRFSYKQNKLSHSNIERLEALGISWDGRDPAWEENFQAFLRGEETPKWRSVQRAYYREGKLKPEREKRLRDAGFEFVADTKNKEKKHVSAAPQELPHLSVFELSLLSNLEDDNFFLDEAALMAWADRMEKMDYDQALAAEILNQTQKIPVDVLDGREGDILLDAIEKLMHASTHRNNDALNYLVMSSCRKITSAVYKKIFKFVSGISIDEGLGELAEYLDGIESKAKIYQKIKAIPLSEDCGTRIIEDHHPIQVRLMGKWIHANAQISVWLQPDHPLGVEYNEKMKELKLSGVQVSNVGINYVYVDTHYSAL